MSSGSRAKHTQSSLVIPAGRRSTTRSLKIRLVPLACFSQVLCANLTSDCSASNISLSSTLFNCVKHSDKLSCVFGASTVKHRSDVEMTLDSRLKSALRDRPVDFPSVSLVRRPEMVLSSCTRSPVEASLAGSWRQW
jgi:hypothetical protein